MTITTKARYANGTLIPLEPLDMPEGTVVTLIISVDETTAAETVRKRLPFTVVPNSGGFAPGVTADNLKDVILDLEDGEFLEKIGR